MQVKSLNDRELIQCYLEGQEKAFEVLLNRYKDKIYTSIYLFVRDEALAEDIFQDVFIKIIRTLRQGRYTDKNKFAPWAMRVAYNMCVDRFRSKRRRPTISPTETFDIFSILRTTDDNTEKQLIRSQIHEDVRELIDSLPSEQREVVILRHYADLSFKEIAALTRVSINTALGRMRYALINMRRTMAEKEMSLRSY